MVICVIKGLSRSLLTRNAKESPSITVHPFVQKHPLLDHNLVSLFLQINRLSLTCVLIMAPRLIKKDHLRLKCPLRFCIAGSSGKCARVCVSVWVNHDCMCQSTVLYVVLSLKGSGKSTFCKRLLESRDYLLDKQITRILYFYLEWNSVLQSISEIPGVEMIKNFNPDLVEEIDGENGQNTLIVCDDHLNVPGIYKHLAHIWTVASRARSLSCIFLTQNLYSRSTSADASYNRQILLNSNYTALFANKRDCSIASNISKVAFPNRYRYFMESYKEACETRSDGHGYLLISSDPKDPKEVELRTQIFFEEEPTILFWERK